MPAVSKKQRQLFAIAEHNPEKLKPANKGLADLPHQTLHDFAATSESDLPKKKKSFLHPRRMVKS